VEDTTFAIVASIVAAAIKPMATSRIFFAAKSVATVATNPFSSYIN
jgi:hypothetical protein